MVFERVVTVKGHHYRYLVMNVREGKKVKQTTLKYLGRVDKGYDNPYGLYYFAQEDCSACETKEQVEHSLMCLQRVIKDEILPKLHYVNLSSDKNPLNIEISLTPTSIEITHTKFFSGRGFYDNTWLAWRYGEKRAKEIMDASQAAWSQEQEDIIQQIKDGKDGKWLKTRGYNDLDILTARGTVRWKKKCERHDLKQAEYEARKITEKPKMCAGGVCPLPA